MMRVGDRTLIRYISIIALLLSSFIWVRAEAKVGSRNLEADIKTDVLCFDSLQVLTSGTDVTEGKDGVIVQQPVDGLSTVTFTMTSTLPTLPFAAQLTYGMHDATTTTDTLTCSNLKIWGKDQFGKNVHHSDTTVAETAETTTLIFESVSRVEVTCADTSAANDAGDAFFLRLTMKLGLPVRLKSKSDIISACVVDASDSLTVKCASYSDASTDDIESALSLKTKSGSYVAEMLFDATKTMFGTEEGATKVAIADDDTLCLKYRSGF